MKLQPFPVPIRGLAAVLAGCLAGVAPLRAQDDEALESIRENMPRVVLNSLVYKAGGEVKATVSFVDPDDAGEAMLALVFATENSKDVEAVTLAATADPRVYVTSESVDISNAANGLTESNGRIELAPGEVFSALLSYKLSKRTPNSGERAWAGDWAMLADPDLDHAQVEVRPGLTLTADELNRPAGLPPLGTLFIEGGVGPVQIAASRLMFLPQSDAQLAEFLARTGAKILYHERSSTPVVDPKDLPEAGTVWLLVEIAGDPDKIPHLPQLRAMAGEQQTLSSSSDEALALLATALELWCEGYLVGLVPRMQLHGDVYWPEGERDGVRIDSFGSIGDTNPNVFIDPNFGIRQTWAFLAMFDFDRARIPVGIIDSGFAPNPDFKTGDPLYAERNLATGASGIGAAQTPQEVGNSFFGDKTWHGNGTVTALAGAPGNLFGSAGVAGQVAVPKLYHMGLGNFAFGFGTAIRTAVDDGCSVINISAGYPCRILSVLGNDDVCSPEGRAAFALKLGLAVRGAAAAACAAAPILDAVLPGLGAATCATAIAAAETAALGIFGTVFLGATRTPVERSVEYATSRGVSVVASAGNRLSGEALGALDPFVNNENSNIDDWQVIPAVIPDVIAVGCCANGGWSVWNGDGNNHYANLHFWGDSVDVWAPHGTWYWAPEHGEVDPATVPAADHIRRTFGATSNAAPIVSGIISNLMAINPALDRRFAPPASLPNLPGQIRDILVDTAHQAGDPAAPDSADDVSTFEYNPETDTNDEIDEPAELLAQMERRRNYVNEWAAVQHVADMVGVIDYPALGYETDLGRDDRIPDVGAPDGVLLPTRTAPFAESEELSFRDREFWYFQTPAPNQLYRARYEVTLPAGEDADSFLINGRPGALVSAAGSEQTVAWLSPNLWRDEHFPTAIEGRWGMDSVYKFNAALITAPLPDPDTYDFGFASNDSLDDAAPVSDWESVEPHGRLEVDAFELCIDGLNFHDGSDVDVFRIDFPEPPLNLPFSCGAGSPSITIRINPPNGNLRMEVFSRAGGSDRLLARSNGSSSIHLSCRDYLGRLPLYVRIQSASGSFAEYALKVRWSIPDQDFGDRLDRIREAHAGGREIPFRELIFPPEVPWLFASPGLLPDIFVNPNPAFSQALDDDGRFLASRLFLVEVTNGNNLDVGFHAMFGAGQSLRMELVSLDNQVFGSVATPDLEPPGQKNNSPPPVDPTQSLTLSFPQLSTGVFILRLSGHRPGDEIALYLSRSLIPPGDLSMEAVLGKAGEFPPTPLGLPASIADRDPFAASSLAASIPPGTFRIEPAADLGFTAAPMEGYQIEILDDDGIWKPFGSPIVEEATTIVSVAVPIPHPDAEFRIAKLGGSDSFPPETIGAAYRLLFQSQTGVPGTLTGSPSLKLNSFAPFGMIPDFLGDGSAFEWLLPAVESPPPPFFFRIEN